MSKKANRPLSNETPPTNAEIVVLLKKILEDANLEEITMKTVCKKVYASYPNHDLSSRKDFIKVTVKGVSSTLNLFINHAN